jgi:hypothetical protein
MRQLIILALMLMAPVLVLSQAQDAAEKQRFERKVIKAEEEWRGS